MSLAFSMLLVLGLATQSLAQPLVVKVTTRKHVYRVGQPVPLTISERNVSTHAVEVTSGCQFFDATISRDGVAIAVFRSHLMCLTTRMPLPTGRTRHIRLRWNGRATEPGAEIVPGEYVITAGVDQLLASTTIRLRAE